MLLKGKIDLTTTIEIEKVWNHLLNPQVLLSCIPGAEKVEQIDKDTYHCVVKQKIGPVSATVKFKASLNNMQPPKHMEFEGQGEVLGGLGHFTQKSTVDLTQTDNGGVAVAYVADIRIGGKLASFGDRIFRAKATEIEKELVNRLDAALKGLTG